MCDTAIQMTLILHDSGVLCQLHILDRELDHLSYPVLLHDSNDVLTHTISCCRMQCIIFMSANRHDLIWIFYSVGKQFKVRVEIKISHIAMIDQYTTVYYGVTEDLAPTVWKGPSPFQDC